MVRNPNASVDRSASVSWQHFPGAWTLEVELGEVTGDVGDGARRLADLVAQPGTRVAVSGVGGDHQEPLAAEFGDRQVALDPPVRVEPLGVGDRVERAVDAARGHVIQHTGGVSALDQELGHEAHVHQTDALADGTVLGLPLLEPGRPAPGGFGDGFDSWPGEPVEALPAGHLPLEPSGRYQAVVNR
jgi:hypothetical protein